jgi:prophage antirepressor-like protein
LREDASSDALALVVALGYTPPPPSQGVRTFDFDKMEFNLNGLIVKVYRFRDDVETPWFQAKPIVLFLEYTQVTHAVDHVHPDDKMAFKDLVESKGVPLEGCSVPLGYHEGKAIFINESGLYALMFGSKKREAKEFKHWVTREVLPHLRKHGSYTCPSNGEICKEGGLVTTVELRPKPKKTQNSTRKDCAATALCDKVRSFFDLVKEASPGLSGSRLKLLTMLSYASFLQLVAVEERMSVDAVSAVVKDFSFGLKAIVPEKWMELASAAVAGAKETSPAAIPTGDAERDFTTGAKDDPVTVKRGKVAFVAEGDHGAAKDAANAMWVQLLRRNDRLFFLDSWRNHKGLELRTLSALLSAGHLAERLCSANPDPAICKQLRLQGVAVQEGDWAGFQASHKFDGIYLDLCSGSESYVRLQLELATSRSAPNCVLGWTLTERDFNGTPLLLRSMLLSEFLYDLGWRPAMQRMSASTLLHRSSASRHQVMTQFWVKQQ